MTALYVEALAAVTPPDIGLEEPQCSVGRNTVTVTNCRRH